jgi:hypothetical protein
MPAPSPLGNQIELALTGAAGYATHPVDHSEYLLRYRTSAGTPFAIGRTSQSIVRFWLSANDRFRRAIEAEGFVCTRSEPKPIVHGKRATGRNSNLDQIEEFKGKPLYWVPLASAKEALLVASKLS